MKSIIYDDEDGRIRTIYYGPQTGEKWTTIDDSQWPEDASGEDEIPRYYYDEAEHEVSIEYEVIEDVDEDEPL